MGCLPYFHTWSGLSANLRCRSETCCTRLAENTGHKKTPKNAIWTPSHNFVGLYLATKAHIDNQEKKLVKQQYLLHMSPQYGELRPTSAEIGPVVWGTPSNVNGFRVLAALLHGTPVVGVSQTVALNRRRHLYSAGRRSRWASTHILVCFCCVRFSFFSTSREISWEQHLCND